MNAMLKKRRPIRTADPYTTPVSLEEVKQHLRIEPDFKDDDAIIYGVYLPAAVAHLDGWGGVLGRCMITQDWRWDLPGFPSCDLVLPFADVSAATVTYKDADCAEQIFSGFELFEDVLGTVMTLASGEAWPTAGQHSSAVSITMTCGYGGPGRVPTPLKSAICLHVGTMFEYRETLSERVSLNYAYNALIAPYRRVAI